MITIAIILILFVVFSIWYSHRNNKVYTFLKEVVNDVAWYNMQVNIEDWLEYPRIDEVYEKILFSFKPLRMDVWFPEINRKIYKEKFNQILNEGDETKKG